MERFMARVLEDVAKEILRNNGIVTPEFAVAETPKQVLKVAEQIGFPVVLKALVPLGKRGKAGAVQFAVNSTEAESHARRILGMNLRHFPVKKLLVESKLDIVQELYISITYDDTRRMPVIIACSEGGIEIEEIAVISAGKIIRHYVDLNMDFHPYQSKEICSALGLTGKILQKGTQALYRLYKIFEKYDATILEVNPLVLTTEDEIVAAAVLMGVDDDALYRQPELIDKIELGSDRAWKPLTNLEKEMVNVDAAESYRGTARYTEMDGGDIGFLCGGGGGSLLAYDALLQYGGQPANYTEFGGNPTETKVTGIVKGVLSKPGVKSFFMDTNITNNTQTDVVAKGIITAFQEKNIDLSTFPTVVRLAGVNDTEARKIFTDFGIEYYGDDVSMEDAARIIVNKMNSNYGK
jgi:succinyl-CoA synthetase beta subunit/citryl-CoA synthetase large subunit